MVDAGEELADVAWQGVAVATHQPLQAIRRRVAALAAGKLPRQERFTRACRGRPPLTGYPAGGNSPRDGSDCRGSVPARSSGHEGLFPRSQDHLSSPTLDSGLGSLFPAGVICTPIGLEAVDQLFYFTAFHCKPRAVSFSRLASTSHGVPA